ncbi:MAG: YifB family Mg chelatase-like AAA ATPase [Actinobacteria bacterium]|nr:YifB family Mg chelatase-like AAA ATPase [Actinomycetota bacterium]
MLAKTESIAIVGTEARLVDVEVDVGTGLPAFRVVGLAAKSITEAEQRTRSALMASGFRWPPHRMVANLAPAALPKEGTHFDLPIALGMLVGDDRLSQEALADWVVMGELALTGRVRPVRGVLAAAIACREAGRDRLMCPAANAAEAAVVEGLEVAPVRTLAECIRYLKGEEGLQGIPDPIPPAERDVDDLREVRGQQNAKTALLIAAAGGHNLLFYGPPGAGKTMLARRLPGVLPEMSVEESLEVTRIYSVAGLLAERASLITERPFRTPHHNVSMAGLLGGGHGLARPGEVSLAHHGVLFLDELPFYKSDALEGLRAPVEDGSIRIARSGGAVKFPCRFSLVAAMNPCPCGFAGDQLKPCTCSDHERQRYGSKLSGPLIDRLDMQVDVGRPSEEELLSEPTGPSSEEVRARVTEARELQTRRYGTSLLVNGTVPRRKLNPYLHLTKAARSELRSSIPAMALSGRAVNRILRLARTIADLQRSREVDGSHILDAITLRASDRLLEAA